MNTKVIVLLVIVIIAAIALGAWYVMFGKKTVAPATQGIGGDIYNQVAPNAAENLPQTNPFKAVQTNPFQ